MKLFKYSRKYNRLVFKVIKRNYFSLENLRFSDKRYDCFLGLGEVRGLVSGTF